MSPSAERRIPEGLVYVEDFLSEEEERALVAWLGPLEFESVEIRGQVARRTVRHFGFGYEYETRAVAPTEPIPADVLWLRDRCAGLADIQRESFAEMLTTRYPVGATIGWHRDAPMFGAIVAGVSLLSACRMRFRRVTKAERLAYDLTLAPRSAYVLGGAARSAWQHSIPPVRELRYSITFRTVRRRELSSAQPRP